MTKYVVFKCREAEAACRYSIEELGIEAWVPMYGEWRLKGRPPKWEWIVGVGDNWGYIYVPMGTHHTFRRRMPLKFAINMETVDRATYERMGVRKGAHKPIYDFQTVTLKELQLYHEQLMEVTEANHRSLRRLKELTAPAQPTVAEPARQAEPVRLGDVIIVNVNGLIMKGDVEKVMSNGERARIRCNGRFVNVPTKGAIKCPPDEKKEALG